MTLMRVKHPFKILYANLGNRLEEDIILKKPPSKTTWSFPLGPAGLKPWVDGTIRFRDKASGQILFYFDKPFMADSAETRSDSVSLTLKTAGQTNHPHVNVEANNRSART